MRRLGGKNLSAITVSVVVACVFGPVALAQPAPLEWSATYSGSGLAEGRGIAVDDGGVYVAGRTQPVGGYSNMFLLKYGLGGGPVWDRTWGGSNSDGGSKVGVAGTEVYVAGFTYSYADDPVGGVESDAVTVKYSGDGVLDTSNSPDGWWTRFSGDAGYYGYDDAADLAVDGFGSLYVLGDSERGSANWYRYTEQYDSSGIKQWHEHYGNSGTGVECRGSGLTMVDGNLYNVGRYETTASGPYDLLVQKYDTDGTPVWDYPWAGGETYENGLDVAVSADDIYVVGYVGSAGDPNGRDLLLLKLHDDGTSVSFVDSIVFSGPGDDIGRGIVEVDGQIYIVGSTDVGGNTDALFLAYDSDLIPLWDTSWGGTGDDAAYDIAYYDGTLYVTGIMNNEAFVDAYNIQVACEQQKLTASDATAGDFFGGFSSVSVDGDIAVIGAFGRDDACPTNPNCLSGAAYVYRFNGLGWVEEAKLMPSDPTEDSLFGYSVEVSGDVVVIGAYRDDWLCPSELRCDSGSAYIFRFDGDNWIEEAKLVAHDGARNDGLGFSVAIDTDTAVVTAASDDDAGQDSGSAYVFQFDGVDSWVEEAKLTASDAAAGDMFGYFASISGNTVVIGAYWDDDACPGDPQCNSGSAYVFEEPVGGWVTTTETAKLTASDAAGGGYFGDMFGNRVAIDGDIILIAAPGNDGAAEGAGAAYAFHRPTDGWATMTETVKLTAWDATAGDAFGSIVSIYGDVAVIGAVGDSDEGAGSGAAYVYRFNGSTWKGQAKVTASDAAPGDGCGAAGSISADTIMIGATWDDDACPGDPGCDSGSVYVFDIADCNANGVCDSQDIASGGSSDCNSNGVPDECEPDCDGDLIADLCEIADCLTTRLVRTVTTTTSPTNAILPQEPRRTRTATASLTSATQLRASPPSRIGASSSCRCLC